jgi:hypothetical protein
MVPFDRSIEEARPVQVLVRDNNVEQALKVLKKKMAQSGCRWHPRREARGHPDGFPAQLELKTERFEMAFRLFLTLRFCPSRI